MAVDLFSHVAIADAEAKVRAAEAARAEAARRYRVAPHGQVRERLRAFQEASHTALKAALELARIRKAAER